MEVDWHAQLELCNEASFHVKSRSTFCQQFYRRLHSGRLVLAAAIVVVTHLNGCTPVTSTCNHSTRLPVKSFSHDTYTWDYEQSHTPQIIMSTSPTCVDPLESERPGLSYLKLKRRHPPWQHMLHTSSCVHMLLCGTICLQLVLHYLYFRPYDAALGSIPAHPALESGIEPSLSLFKY